MIQALKTDELVAKCGGRFKLTVLIQKRWRQLMDGARPMVDPAGKTTMEVIIEEIMTDKLKLKAIERKD